MALAILDSSKVLKEQRDLVLQITVAGGSMGGIAALGEGQVEVALSSKWVSPQERANYPDILFTEIPIGTQAMALTVSRDVWDGGIHALSREQIRNIYEGKIRNWKEVGGPDRKIAIFMSEQGRGLWEMFAQWVYGEVKKAPVKKYQNLASYTEMRNAVEFTPGSFGQLPTSLADRRITFPLGIREGEETIEATTENIASGKYPLTRPLLLVVNNKPALNVKVLVDFMLSAPGQEMVKKAGMLPLSELNPAKP